MINYNNVVITYLSSCSEAGKTTRNLGENSQSSSYLTLYLRHMCELLSSGKNFSLNVSDMEVETVENTKS
jgi:hypothetical protein